MATVKPGQSVTIQTGNKSVKSNINFSGRKMNIKVTASRPASNQSSNNS